MIARLRAVVLAGLLPAGMSAARERARPRKDQKQRMTPY